MTTYIIRQTSIFLWTITMLGTIFAGMGLVILLAMNGVIPKGQTWLVFVLIVPIFFLAFKVPRFTATVDIELIMDEEGFKKKWLKQFIFSNKPDINIKWTEIQDYVFEPDRQFDKFKMTLKDGSKFKFSHNNDYNDKDEFLTFLRHFEQKINQINTDKNAANDIKRGKTIYETTWGLVLATFAILIIVAIPVMFIFFPTKNTPNYAAIGVSYVGALYFLFQVYSHRQRNKENQ